MKYLICIVISILCFSKVCLSQDAGVCIRIVGKELPQFLDQTELKYGQKVEDKNKAVKAMISCLNNNKACVVGFEKNSNEIKVWSFEKNDFEFSSNYVLGDEILFAVLQREKDSSCIAATRLLVRAQPWYVKAFVKQKGDLNVSDSLSSFPTFANMSPTPSNLLESLKLSYEYWVKKSDEKERKRKARERRFKERLNK